jgi:copper chaperone NosL
MRKMIFSFLLLAFSLTLGCSKEISPIDYGKDQCSHCRMTIVDNKYGSEIVTQKGKAMKFDAAECLINYLLTNKVAESDLDMMLVTDLTQPGKFIDARSASFLISPKLRSPMGENISAFPDKKSAEKFQSEFGGEVYDWAALIQMLGSR